MNSASDSDSDPLSFKTVFAVELHCEACVRTVKRALSEQQGIASYEISLQDQRVTVEGRVAPSAVAKALRRDGRQVIVRGTGTASGGEIFYTELEKLKPRSSQDVADHDGAAVCIFESYTPPASSSGSSSSSSSSSSGSSSSQSVHGIARLVQVRDTALLDLTIRHDDLARAGVSNGSATLSALTPSSSSSFSRSPSSSSSNPFPHGLAVYVATSGDLSTGASSTGKVFKELGKVQLREKDGYGDLFTELKGTEVWSLVGRAMVIAPLLSPQSSSPSSSSASASSPTLKDKQTALQFGPGILAGVIARSAGAWDNDKSVCSCSGKNLWQEAKEVKL